MPLSVNRDVNVRPCSLRYETSVVGIGVGATMSQDIERIQVLDCRDSQLCFAASWNDLICVPGSAYFSAITETAKAATGTLASLQPVDSSCSLHE